MLLATLLAALAPAAFAADDFSVTAADGGPLDERFANWAKSAHAPLPTGEVKVDLTGCPGRPDLVGCVNTNRPRKIYLNNGVSHERAVFLHELGHVFDLTTMRRGDRKEFRRLHGRVGQRWWRGEDPPGEWFAEAYSLCARYGSRHVARAATTYGYRPSAKRHRASCKLIKDAAARRSPRKPVKPPPAPPTISDPVPPPPPPSEPPPPQCFLLIFCS